MVKISSDMEYMRNFEGYKDPTAGVAMKNADRDYERFKLLIDTLHKVCKLAGFHIEEKVVVKDLKTGRVWR